MTLNAETVFAELTDIYVRPDDGSRFHGQAVSYLKRELRVGGDLPAFEEALEKLGFEIVPAKTRRGNCARVVTL